MIKQAHITLRPYPRGIHLVSSEVLRQLPPLPRTGLLHLLIQHTSAALALNENADPDVRLDLAAIFDRLVPENAPFYLHTDEGSDDMPSHAKAVIVGSTLTLPISEGLLDWASGKAYTFASSATTAALVASSPPSSANNPGHKPLHKTIRQVG